MSRAAPKTEQKEWSSSPSCLRRGFSRHCIDGSGCWGVAIHARDRSSDSVCFCARDGERRLCTDPHAYCAPAPHAHRAPAPQTGRAIERSVVHADCGASSSERPPACSAERSAPRSNRSAPRSARSARPDAYTRRSHHAQHFHCRELVGRRLFGAGYEGFRSLRGRNAL
jgi:hypothetical protein